MLYGNLIFIKKTGGDGSKFPVTEKDIKIGRSENCLIRIYNPQVAPEHCQLIIEDNGQAILRNLSNHTVLNGKPLGQGDTTLCHGDVFKIGARSARWEYLPSSVNFRQPLSPQGQTGRLVAVVMPQQRSLGGCETPGTSASQVSILKGTPLGKRVSESSSATKIRKSSGFDLIHKSKGDLLKLLTGRHSLKSTKLMLQTAKVKERKSTSGVPSTKTPTGKTKINSRKSTFPSWKVNILSSPDKNSLENGSYDSKTIKKSIGSSKSAVKTPLKTTTESKAEKLLLSASKSEIKTPERPLVKTKTTTRTSTKSSKSETSAKSTPSLSKSPTAKKISKRSPSKAVFSTPRQKHHKLSRAVYSENKVKSTTLSAGKRRIALSFSKLDSPPCSVKEFKENEKSSNSTFSELNSVDEISHSSAKTDLICEPSPAKRTSRKSLLNNSVKKTPVKTVESPKNGLPAEAETQKKTTKKTINSTVGLAVRKTSRESGESDLEEAPSTKRRKYSPRKTMSSANTPLKKTPAKLVKSVGRSPSSSSRKMLVTQVTTPPFDSKAAQIETSQRGRKLSTSKTPIGKSTKASGSPRGVRRRLSPTSNAERAAKKLKTSSPKKPDKNKKAALLVLGIASRNQILSQNVKALLKRKIVKKAIKQSTAVSVIKNPSKKKNVPKAPRKKISKPTKKPAKSKKPGKSSAPSSKSPTKEKTVSASAKSVSQLNSSVQQASTNILSERQKQNSETSALNLSKSYASETASPSCSFENTPENFSFASNRRCSKRLSSKNETDRPDFIELCPTALGLMPKNVDIFKTPKVNKRRSFSMTTPKNLQASGIIKSASTSKIGNRKSVRFSSKEGSFNSEMLNTNVAENSLYDFTPFQTPDITVDMFVSPIADKSSAKKDSSQSAFKMEEISKTSLTKTRRSTSDSKTCVRKLLQSPQSENSLGQKAVSRSSRITASQSPSPAKVVTQSKIISSGNLSEIEGIRQLFATPKAQKSPKNSLSDLKGVPRLLRTPKDIKSPKNDLTDVKGVKKLFRTPKVQKSPRNDLTDVKGVQKLFQTPKVEKSPKNDLTDVKGVKKLFQTPKVQKNPRNDLTDVRGVKKLLETPKPQKSPKNDLSDVRGVKKLLRTPKAQKSPKNDLSDVRGVKKLLQSPRIQKSPKNDLSDVAGVKQLLKTPRLQKSPKNDLSDLTGVKNLFRSPKAQNSPKSDLNYLTGVQRLFATARVQKSPKNNLLDVSGVGNLYQSPVKEKFSRSSTEGTNEQSKSITSEETFNESITNVTGVKQLLVSSSESDSKSKKTVSRKSRVNDFRAIRGRRTIYSTPKGPKNDLSDLTGVRELFCRHKPTCDFEVDLTGVAGLFELPGTKASSTQKVSTKETDSEDVPKRSKSARAKRALESESKKDTEILTRGGRLRKAATKEPAKKVVRTRKTAVAAESEEKRPSKRKAEEEAETTLNKKTQKVTKSETKAKSRTRTTTKQTENSVAGIRGSRKRKTPVENSETSEPKLRRKLTVVEASSTSATRSGSSRRATGSAAESEKKPATRRVKKPSEKVKSSSKVQSKTAVKTVRKQVQKVQSRSQTSSKKRASDSEGKISPRKTRSFKTKAPAQKASKTSSAKEKAPGRAAAGAKKASPALKRSTRRK